MLSFQQNHSAVRFRPEQRRCQSAENPVHPACPVARSPCTGLTPHDHNSFNPIVRVDQELWLCYLVIHNSFSRPSCLILTGRVFFCLLLMLLISRESCRSTQTFCLHAPLPWCAEYEVCVYVPDGSGTSSFTSDRRKSRYASIPCISLRLSAFSLTVLNASVKNFSSTLAVSIV